MYLEKCMKGWDLSLSLFYRNSVILNLIFYNMCMWLLYAYWYECMLMCYPFPLECLQAINRQRVLDRFKSREDNFYDKLEDDLFMDVYAMHAHAQKTHLLASKWGIGNVKQELWRSHANFLQRIIDNVAFNSHGWAVRELKAYFGGEEDLTKS